jgi:hypothetical protein
VLPLWRPRYQVVTEEDTVTWCRTTSVGAANPVDIGISDEISGWGAVELKTVIKSALNVLENPLDQGEMRLPWVMHIEANLLDGISNVRSGECEILQGAQEAMILCHIRDWGTIRRELGTCVNRSRTQFAIRHPDVLKNINHILALWEKETPTLLSNWDTQEVMQCAKILHGEFCSESINNPTEQQIRGSCEDDVVHI